MSATPNTAEIAAEFPGLAGEIHGKPLVYLDSAATTQKHASVLERLDRFMREEYGTVHRGLYARSVESTRLYEEARAKVATFVGTSDEREIVFTMGCTDAINLVAWSWGRANLGPGDRILVSEMEHHSNLVPWQIVAEIAGAEVAMAPMDDAGTLDLDALRRELGRGAKLVAVNHVSNSLGTLNPVRMIADMAHEAGALLLVDAAQSAPHVGLDVADMDCDFLAFSAHKCYGPNGIGALWGRYDLLDAMPPWRGGGEMIERVSFAGTTFAHPPSRFEAGTPPISEAIGFGAACDFLRGVGLDRIAAHEAELYAYAEGRLDEVPGLRRIGTARERMTALSFVMEGAHPADVAQIVDMEGIAIRAGHHCAQPVMDHFGIPATARISLGIYTTREDVDRGATALIKAADILGVKK